MTIDEKLFAILTAPAVAAVPTWWANAAAQGVEAPYGVYSLISSPQILTHDRQTETSRWVYEVTIVHSSYLEGAQAMKDLMRFFTNYTDAPRPGIMRFIPLNQRSGYLSNQRLHQFWGDVDIMENVP